MAKYSVPFETRKRGAIGIFETRTYTVEADDEERAREAAFASAQAEGYETRGSGPVRKLEGARQAPKEISGMVITAAYSDGSADYEPANPKRYARWLDPILGRMVVEHAKDVSDAEITRTLAGCVLGPKLIEAAKIMREGGMLTLEALETMRSSGNVNEVLP